MKSPKATTALISLRSDKPAGSTTQSAQNRFSSPQKLSSPKGAAGYQASTDALISPRSSQTSNLALKNFTHTMSPRNIPAALLSAEITKTDSNSDKKTSFASELTKSFLTTKTNGKDSTPAVKKNVPEKKRYQSQTNNPFLKDGYRCIGTLEKRYPEIETFQSSDTLDLTLSPRGAMTDRAMTDRSREPYSPVMSVTLNKKFEKYQQQIQGRTKLLEEQARNYESQSKKHGETANQVKEMRNNLQTEIESIAQEKEEKKRPRSVGNRKRMTGSIHHEKNTQNFLEKKKEELNKAEETALERLRVSQNIENQAKETLNRLSAMRAAREKSDRVKAKGLKTGI